MKKAISFVLAALMLVSAVPTALATNDYTQGTQVVYTATGSESYTITVPAQLAPGGNGTVTLQGTWADNRIITVTAEPTVTLTNSIKAEDQKVLNVHFDGISEAGSNIGSQTFTEGVSVDDITNALFGTWSGKFNYNVDVTDTFTAETASGTYVFANDVSPSQHDLSIKLSSDTVTDFSNTTVKVLGQNLLDVDALIGNGFSANGDNTYTLSKLDENKRFSKWMPTPIRAGQTIEFTATLVDCSYDNPSDIYTNMFMYVWGKNDETTHVAIQVEGNKLVSEPCKLSYDVAKVAFYWNQGLPDGTYVTMENLQLAIRADGETLEYVPYTAQEAVANADGTVTGLKSVSPAMFIYTDNDEVQIECEYNSVKKN